MLIYVSLCLGILIGVFNLIPKRITKYNDKFTLFGVLLLLFVMGLSIGSNKDIIKNIHILGISGLIYAIFTVLFSIIFVVLLTGGKKK